VHQPGEARHGLVIRLEIDAGVFVSDFGQGRRTGNEGQGSGGWKQGEGAIVEGVGEVVNAAAEVF
jgi:hypothetical protein